MPTTFTSDTLRERVTSVLRLESHITFPAAAPAREDLGQGLRAAAEHHLASVHLSRIAPFHGTPASGEGGYLLHTVPLALTLPLNRPLLRRLAAHLPGDAPQLEGIRILTIAAGLVAADLLSHDIPVVLLRVHQSLLEEAPTLVLDWLRETSSTPAADVSDQTAEDVFHGALSLLTHTTLEELLHDSSLWNRAPVTCVLACAWLACAGSHLPSAGHAADHDMLGLADRILDHAQLEPPRFELFTPPALPHEASPS